MKSAQILRQKIASGQPVLGMLVIQHVWLELIEVMIKAKLDFAIIDNEHRNAGDTMVSDALAMGRMLDFPILLRPPEPEYNAVRVAMDRGPCGLLLPTVSNTRMLDEVRDGIYMPPRGRRRPGGPGNRWVSDYNYATWKREVEDNLIIIPQIENREGLDNVDAIVRHEIVTAAGVGPYDLSASLGVCWKPDSPVLINALDRIRTSAAAVGKSMLMVGDPDQWIPRGLNFICIGEPVAMMEGAMTQRVAQVRSTYGSKPSGSAGPTGNQY
ncbi:MAG: hypothetical protein JNG83_11245 [Opitutaceae bacterium]|nr:hypothetical protein [Opitutaceae bacterium]